MGVLSSDTFTRANQSGWGTASDGETWVKIGGSTPTLAISSNEGTWTGVIASGTYALGTNTAADAEVVMRFKISAVGDSVGLILRSDATAQNFYRAFVQNTNLTIAKNISGVSTTLINTTITFNTGTLYWLRFRVVGSNLYAKFWADGSGEPAAWTSTASDSAITTAGRWGQRNSLSVATDTVSVDSFSVNQVYTLTEQTEGKFFTRMPLGASLESKFSTRMGLSSGARAKFLTQMRLLLGARSKFSTRLLLSSAARARFAVRMGLLSPARSKFIVEQLFAPFKLNLSSTKNLLSLLFTEQALLTLTFTEVPLASPNSTIQVTVNATNINGISVSNLASLTCVITFPDGTQSPTYSLSSGITNAGGGNYVLTYTTKGPGINKELWTGTDAQGNAAQYLNITSVSF